MTTLKETLESMRNIATTLDIHGKFFRNKGITYKAAECFAAANKLREAAQETEYALS
jgi:hypothetical protein